eukprot:scaffold37084_cov45-Phaeocystis_antarctica.AAC.1
MARGSIMRAGRLPGTLAYLPRIYYHGFSYYASRSSSRPIPRCGCTSRAPAARSACRMSTRITSTR